MIQVIIIIRQIKWQEYCHYTNKNCLSVRLFLSLRRPLLKATISFPFRPLSLKQHLILIAHVHVHVHVYTCTCTCKFRVPIALSSIINC